MKLANKLALITGGGRGIGRAIALAFAKEGADIVVAARTPVEIDQVAKEVESLGAKALAVQCNVANPQSVTQTFEQVRAKFERGPDILVNSAGIAESELFIRSDEAMWERHLNVNLRGTFRCTQAALSEMIERGWGRIINIA